MPSHDHNKEVVAQWDHMHRYSPAPRHRRKIILNFLKTIQFNDCLDAGCAQGYLLDEIAKRFNIRGHGCDISSKVIEENMNRFPHLSFHVLDVEKEVLNHKQFDVVISSEVIEHIHDWKGAIHHLTQMTKKYLIITLPAGKVRAIDKKVGHHRHYDKTLKHEIERYGFLCDELQHGFPIHSLYKRLINFRPEQTFAAFSGKKSYSLFKIIFSQIIYYLFYIDYLFKHGEQVFIFAKRIDHHETSTI